MKKRIKELAKKAGVEEDWASTMSTAVIYKFSPNELEKFTELIIRECIAVVESENDQGSEPGGQWDRAIEVACNDLKQHFGIK